MAINETFIKGRSWRKNIENDPNNKKWNTYSFRTASSDVIFDDGSTLDDKLANVKGVTKDENAPDGYAADISLVRTIKNLVNALSKLVNNINYRLGGLRFYEDSNGKWVVGADSVPKKLGSSIIDISPLALVFLKDYKDIKVDGILDNSSGNWEEVGAIYGNITRFDLTSFEGYKDFVFGENIVAVVNSFCPAQSMGQATGLLINPKIQRNIDNLDYNSVKITDFYGDGKYAPQQFDASDERDYLTITGGDKGFQKILLGTKDNNGANGFQRYSTSLLYIAETGTLYVVSFSTGYVQSVALYCI